MTKEDKYDILYDKTILQLKARVEDKIRKGWEPSGSVTIQTSVKWEGKSKKYETVFYQTMKKTATALPLDKTAYTTTIKEEEVL